MKIPRTILLIEDNEDDVILIERSLSKSGIEATYHVVRDGDEALDYLRGSMEYQDRERFPLPDLILLDLKLPRRSGLEVLSWIRGEATNQKAIVVVLTSSKESNDVNRAYALGANSYVVKPISPQGMNELIKTVGSYWLTMNELPRSTDAGL